MYFLGAGIALSLSRSPRESFEILGEVSEDLSGISKSHLKRAIKSLYKAGSVKEEKNLDGTVRVVLSKDGKKLAEECELESLQIKKPKRWDGNWRIVIFDVPEKFRFVRDSVRSLFRGFGFYELQKSVFVYPFPCLAEIGKVVKFYGAEKHFRLITANSLDNEAELIDKFNLKT